MARNGFAGFVLASLALAGSGCGTVSNLRRASSPFDDRPEVYGGVQEDVHWGSHLLAHGVGGWDGLLGRAASLAMAPYVFCIDLPLSAVGDTLTLPVAIRASREPEAVPTLIGAAQQAEGPFAGSVERAPACRDCGR